VKTALTQVIQNVRAVTASITVVSETVQLMNVDSFSAASASMCYLAETWNVSTVQWSSKIQTVTEQLSTLRTSAPFLFASP